MLMVLLCHSQEPRDLNNTGRSYSTGQTRFSPACHLPPTLSSSMVCPVTCHFSLEPKGFLPMEKSPNTEMTVTWRSC